MYKIYIDTTDRVSNKIQLIKDKKVVSERVGKVDVTASIKEVLDENKLKLSDVASFDMNPGPGSFTGLKIGASVVNALRFATGKSKEDGFIIPTYTPSKFD